MKTNKFFTSSPVFIIAELSANHNNDFDLAVKTIEKIAKSGADAVKVQTYKPESLTIDLNSGYLLLVPMVHGKAIPHGIYIRWHQCLMNGNQN